MTTNVAFYSHVIDFAGTWRSHERIAEILQHDERFNVSILYSSAIQHNRLQESKIILNKCNFIEFQRSLQKTDSQDGWRPLDSNIENIVKNNNIHIFHFARSGYYEWPFTSRISPVQIETNIFGYKDSSQYLDGSIFIGRCLGLDESSNSILLPNPIPRPSEKYQSISSLRKELKIGHEDLVFGRIGRPANFTPISLIAYKKFRKNYSGESKYVIMGGCDDAKKCVDQLSLNDDVIFIDCTNDDEYIERFYKTIDIFAHYRSDGEICSTAISQSMMFGVPVITHVAGLNGQKEWLGDGGFFTRNDEDYSKAMMIMSNAHHRSDISKKAERFAIENFDQKTIVDRIVRFYQEVARSKNCEF